MAFSSIFDLWNKLNIRGILILSLSLQVFLILFAPLRKKILNAPIVFFLWLAYLMADWVATFGIGYISHSQGKLFARATKVDTSLHAFWTSFLLLHLGGPDTIIAFSLQDSLLWRRHLLSLIFQVSISIYVFVMTFAIDKSLMIPTMLLFFAGVIKNVERILALFLSSLPIFRISTLASGKQFDVTRFKFKKELKKLKCGHSNEERAKLAESIVVKHAYFFFHIFKVFLSDLFCDRRDRQVSRKYFHKVCAVDALRVISVELNFMYEVLHTKALVIRFKWSYIFRFLAFIEIIVAFVLFNRFKKHQLPKLDVAITYILLFGGIALEVITLFIFIFSDWTIAEIMHHETRQSEPDSFLLQSKKKLHSFLGKLISAMADLGKPRFATCKVKSNANATYGVLDTPFIFRRWSESISACNIFSEFLKLRAKKPDKRNQCWGTITFSNTCSLPFHMAEKIISLFRLTCKMFIILFRLTCKIFIEGEVSLLILLPKHTIKNPFINKLWMFIFEEVRRKSAYARNPIETRKIFEARGNMFLQGRPGAVDLLEFVTKPTYDVSVILWHIATEIWYRQENPTERNDEREFSKILSDYMFYLFINQPNVISTIGGFSQINIMMTLSGINVTEDVKDVKDLCGAIYKGVKVEDFRWTNPLQLGIELAHKMESFGERKWKVMSGVWVEILSYAAGHIKGEAHAQVLSKGGEFLTFVWLLMAHFGCLYKPEWGTFEDEFFDAELQTELNDGNGNQEEDVSTVEAEHV